MKIQNRHSFTSTLMAIIAFFSLLPTSVFAKGETAYLTPASGISQPESTFTVSVDGYVGASQSLFYGTYKVTGSLSFPSSLLQVDKIDATGATFPKSTITPNNSNGQITFNQQANWWQGVSRKTVHLFTITFRAKSSGTANVTFGSVEYTFGFASTSGGVYSITSPPITPTAPTTTTTDSSSLNNSPQDSSEFSSEQNMSDVQISNNFPQDSSEFSSEQNMSDVQISNILDVSEQTPPPVSESDGGLKIDDVKVTATRQENKVTWTTNNPAAEFVFRYGTQKSNKNSDGTIIKQKDGSYEVVLTSLNPGTLYYFNIQGASSNGLQGANYSGTIITRGYPVQLTIEQNNLMIAGAKIKIGEREFVSDKNGIIRTELSDGLHEANVVFPGSDHVYNTTFTVVKKPIPNTGSPELQTFVLSTTAIGKSDALGATWILPLVGGAAAVITSIGGLISFALLRRRKMDGQNEIDGDLLSAAYGTALDQYRSNTPAPNLETINPVSPVKTLESDSQQNPDATMQTSYLSDDGPLLNNDSTNIGDTVIPAQIIGQPNNVLYSDASSSIEDVETVVPPEENIYSENEQLSPDVDQLESTDRPFDEPSAVFNATNGELEIIHNNSRSKINPMNNSQGNITGVDKFSVPSQSIEEPPASPSKLQQPLTSRLVSDA